MVEIRLMAIVTMDGYIARQDGTQDWYLNPIVYGINSYFSQAVAVLNLDKEEYVIETKNGEVFHGKELRELLFHVKDLTGYIALEVIPETIALITSLLEHQLIDELHLITIPICIGNGIRLFEQTNTQTQWRAVETNVKNDVVETKYLR